MLTKQLQEENAKLVTAVEEAKRKLIELEIKNGVKQIPIPQQSVHCIEVEENLKPIKVEENQASRETNVQEKTKKEKKDKKTKEQKPAAEEPPVDVGRLDLRIGKVEDVERHPDADSLYVLKINSGEEKPRTVCSGLVKHISIGELQNKTVMLLCNLKPVKVSKYTSSFYTQDLCIMSLMCAPEYEYLSHHRVLLLIKCDFEYFLDEGNNF